MALLAAAALTLLSLVQTAPAAPPVGVGVVTRSAFCNNMAYRAQMAFRGASYRVLSPGQLGQLQFDPGDVILRVGVTNANINIPLDALIQKAIQEGNQWVIVRDVNSGNVLTLPF
jgi:hypothetical protein